jgi:hypothetical protein
MSGRSEGRVVVRRIRGEETFVIYFIRRPAGGPGGGCARRPVGTYLYLHAVGAGNPIAVLGLAR